MAVTDEAILKIKEMILSGELKPGDRLEPEKELSERLGLSRSSLREAVKALEIVRVLDVRRGDGTYVTSLEPDLLLEAMSFVVDLHSDQSVLEIFAVRRILEPATSALAAQNADPADLARLRELLEGVDAASELDALIEHDLEFHRGIASMAGNAYLTSLLESMSGRTVRARIWRGITQENATDRTIAEHDAILSALEAGDQDLARAVTLTHIAGIEAWLRAAAL
ncbi:FadR/GntR family transcriptional regulator [Agromyces aureus]|uniref:GntR family transcriptional regulator n=1 Tax=Agromyces aureus TaxID=453304 RepID=A0A191WH08_9MICO|nr:FadR/GntR family transcriptional regulator [Agromyces aureus]ANJ27507.1 GntR family transcriptional regulator [Agromyces aureus]